MEYDIALLTLTLVACVPTSSSQKSPDTMMHGQIPWLTGHDFHHQFGRRHQSASPHAYGAPGPDHHCGIGRTGTHHWRYSVSIVWDTTFCASSPTHGGVACAQSEPRTSGWTPRPISSSQKLSPGGWNWHPPPKSADHLHSQTRSRDEVVRSSSQVKDFYYNKIIIIHRMTQRLKPIWIYLSHKFLPLFNLQRPHFDDNSVSTGANTEAVQPKKLRHNRHKLHWNRSTDSSATSDGKTDTTVAAPLQWTTMMPNIEV